MRRLGLAVILAPVLEVGPWLALALISWWMFGDLSERHGYMTIIDLPQSASAAHVAAILGLVIGLASMAVGWCVRRRFGELPGSASVALIVAILFGIATGFSFRLMSSRSYGANIGGGGLMLVWPASALLLGGLGAFAVWRMAGQVVRDNRLPVASMS